MKPFPLRALPLMQTDLFDTARAAAPLTNLQLLHRDELVELLSQLQWQVAGRADITQQLEDEVGDPGAELAEHRAELLLAPAAQGLDGQAPAACQFVLAKCDAIRWIGSG